MNTIQTSLLALLAVMILTLSMSLIADQSDGSNPAVSENQQQGDVSAKTDAAEQNVDNAAPQLVTASSRKPADTNTETASTLTDSSSASTGDQKDEAHREQVWSDISDAITSLNDMVGDDMFRELTRKSPTTMEVRVDLDYWQRVRYETRVDLKNDISNIWHLYVRQYNEDNESAVFFIDDLSGKTIDIFTQRRRSEQ